MPISSTLVIVNKKIKKEELNSFLLLDWKKGRI
jgi:hypothetical protein